MLPIQLPVSKTIKRQILHKNVVFIEKTKLSCVTLPDKTVREYVYPQDMVTDGDVMKKDEFRNAFVQWLADSHIKPADTICIVSAPALFERTIPPNPKTKTIDTNSLNVFIDSIPFQHLATVKKPTKDGSVKVIVANRDLLSGIYHGLEKSAFNVLGIFPELTLTTENPTQAQDLVESAKKHLTVYSLKNAQQYIFDIFPHTHRSLTQMSVSEAAQQPVQPWVVVAVVLLLVGGGVGVWYMQYYQVRQNQMALAKKRAQLLAEQQAVQTDDNGTGIVPVSAGDTGIPSEASPPGSLSLTQTTAATPTPHLLRVQIVYTTNAQKLFDDVYNKLRQTGEYQISNQMSNRTIEENSILLAPTLDTENTARISSFIDELGITTTTKEATIDGFDVVIELGVYSPSAPSPAEVSPTP